MVKVSTRLVCISSRKFPILFLSFLHILREAAMGILVSLNAPHSCGASSRTPEPNLQSQRPSAGSCLTSRWHRPPSTLSRGVRLQRLHIHSVAPLHRLCMLPRLELVCQEGRLFAEPEEALHEAELQLGV
jgi:hypothetical protein